MSNTIYDFNESINVGNRGEKIIKSYLENNPNIVSVIDVSKDKKYQDEDIDFIVKLKSGEEIPIELKTDTYVTKNIFYEYISNIEYNVEGCMIKSKAKCLFYYFINTKELYIIDFKSYREWVEKNYEMFDKREVKNTNKRKNGITHSLGLLIPKSTLKEEKEMAGRFKVKILDCA